MGLSHLSGIVDGRRQQFLIGQSFLARLKGRAVTAISFRRDGQPTALSPGQGDIRLLVSQGVLTDARHATPSFDTNLGLNPVTAFAGRISAPSSPRPTNRNAVGFGADEVVTITFSAPWVYVGGTLCLDIAGTPAVGSTTRAWPIDVDRDDRRGTIALTGRSCIQIAQRVTRHISADPASLRPGSTMRIVAFAGAGDMSLLLIAAQRLPAALSLAMIGSPTCELWVLPDVMLWTAARPNTPSFPATANAYLHTPPDSALLNAVLHTQWLVVQGAALRTSEAAALQFASLAAPIDGAIVVSTPYQGSSPPAVGEVATSAVPVLQIHYQ
jgi:hypothetical protein